MKKGFLLLFFAAMASLPCLQAEDYVVDLNFTRDSTDWISVMPAMSVVGTYNFQTSGLASANIYYDYSFAKSVFGKFATATYKYQPANAEKPAENFVYAIRLNNQIDAILNFPKVESAGTMKIHCLNGNGTTAVTHVVEKYNEESSAWEEAGSYSIPGNGSRTVADLFSVNINVSDSVKLRIRNPAGGYNAHIYAVTVTKYITSALNPVLSDYTKIALNGREISITSGEEEPFQANVYDLRGVQVCRLTEGNVFVLPTTGAYIVRIITAKGVVNKKIVVKSN